MKFPLVWGDYLWWEQSSSFLCSPQPAIADAESVEAGSSWLSLSTARAPAPSGPAPVRQPCSVVLKTSEGEEVTLKLEREWSDLRGDERGGGIGSFSLRNMAVSTVLVPGDPTSAFPRQQAGVTSSVRLRKRRDDLTAPGRKKERHSGDFSFIRASENDIRGAVVAHTRGKDSSPCTSRPMEADHSGRRREVDPILRVSLQCSKVVSSSAVNLRETPGCRGQRQSGDFSQVQWGQKRAQREGKPRPMVPSSQEEVRPRLRPRQEEEAKLRVTPVYQDKPKLRQQPHSHEGVKLRVKPRAEINNCPHRRQSSYQPDLLSAPGGHREANSKRCSGEFEFRAVRRRSQEWLHSSLAVCENLGKTEEQSFTHEMVMRELSGAGDTRSEGSEESGIFSTGSSQESPRKPRPGLGRRAVTQVDLKERKNSYNSALARSQENLVTVSDLCFLPQDSWDSIYEGTATVPDPPKIFPGLRNNVTEAQLLKTKTV